MEGVKDVGSKGCYIEIWVEEGDFVVEDEDED